jgi:hypothetical protein
MTCLYNKYPTLEEGIDVSFDKSSSNHRIVDFTDLGIVHDGLTNKFIQCFGDPRNWAKNWGIGMHDTELDVMKILGNYYGIEKPIGYITSGGTEGNLAGIWWCKRYLTIRSKVSVR